MKRQLRSFVWCVAAGALWGVVALAGGCDDGPPARPPTATAPASRPSTAPVDPGPPGVLKAGFAKGRILGEDGQPIAAPGARITVLLRGVASKTSEMVAYYPVPDADGYYAAELPAGDYRPPVARIEVSFNGFEYRFTLDPVQERTRTWESAAGIVQDFTWKLTGVRPGMRADPTRVEPWHGGAIWARYVGFREDLQRLVPTPPHGTKVIFTLTPKGKFVDGREGKPVTFERPYDALIGLVNVMLPDVPLAQYTMSGVEVYPGGRRASLQFLDGRGWHPEIDGTFEPDLDDAANSNGLKPVKVVFTRPAEVMER